MASSTITKGPAKSYFRKQLIALKVLGISFAGNESVAYKLYSFFIIFSTSFAYMILDGWELFKHDFETSASFVTYQLVAVIAMLKTLTILIHRIKFGQLLAKLQQEPFLPNPNRGGHEEEDLISDCNWKIDAQTNVYWVGTTVSMFVSSGLALSTRFIHEDYHKWAMGFGPFTVLNVTYSPNYEISWFYQSFSIILVAFRFTTIDLIVAAALAHISYQFKILQNFFRVIIKRSYEEMLKGEANEPQGSATEISPPDAEIDPSTIPWKYLEKSIKQVVSYHQAIIDTAEEMERFFRYLLLQTFLISLGCLCFELYHALTQRTALGFLNNMVEYMSVVFQVGTICYWGEQVKFESQQVAQAAAETNFIGSDVRFQKGLVLIIARSQRPTKLTAGKFFDISLSTFTWVLRTSYTVFMVLKNTNENNFLQEQH